MYVVSRKLFLKQVPLHTPEWEILLSLKKNYACFYWKILLDVCSDRSLVLGKMAKNSNRVSIYYQWDFVLLTGSCLTHGFDGRKEFLHILE